MNKKEIVNNLSKCTTKANAKEFADYQVTEVCYMVTMLNTNVIKVGYTSNLNRRMNEYITHNPSIRLVDVVEGNQVCESLFRQRLEELGCEQVNGSEWYKLPKYINKANIKKGFAIMAT